MRFRDTRLEVLEACIALADRGYLAGTGGNVALRADDDHFAVTPSAVDYYAITEADVCIVRLSDMRQVEGERRASVESTMHGRVLGARHDCGASVHTHQPIASAYALLGVPLDVSDEATRASLGRRVPRVGYAPSGTDELASLVARALTPTATACLMRNHGAICIGANAAEAIARVEALETACADYFLAGADTNLPEGVRTAVIDVLRGAMQGRGTER